MAPKSPPEPYVPWSAPPPLFGGCDPGKEHAGLGLFYEGRLAAADKLVSKHPWPTCHVDMAFAAQLRMHARFGPHAFLSLLVVEHPEIRHGAGKDFVVKTADDLLFLPMTNGAIIAALRPMLVEAVPPSRWKGNVDGDILTERIKSKLTADELSVVPKGADHNCYDAIGICLWRLGRIHPERR